MPRRPHLIVGGALAVVLLAGCGPVEIEQHDLSGQDRAACEAFIADLPDTLVDQSPVEVEPADALGAAYGDPPIVVTCGVPAPEGFDPLVSQCESANGVGYYIPPEVYDDQQADAVITTAGHEPRVEIVVPADYRPGGIADVMAALAPLVEEHLTLVDDCV